MADDATAAPTPGRVAVKITASIALAVLIVIGAWHGLAEHSYRSSLPTGVPLASRLASAERAAWLEPWNERYARRARLVSAWRDGDALLRARNYLGAVNTLSAAMGHTPAEPDLLDLYHRAQEALTLDTNRKAHLQHGHEGPGGTLRPQDVER